VDGQRGEISQARYLLRVYLVCLRKTRGLRGNEEVIGIYLGNKLITERWPSIRNWERAG